MKAEFVDLSEELVGEILCRLDAETLSNCCCVCKTWYRIISDPIFGRLHRQFLLTNANLMVVDRWWDKEISTGEGAFSFTMCIHNNVAGRRMECASEKDFIFNSKTFPNIGSRLLIIHWLTCDMLLFSSFQGCHLLNPRTGDLHTLPGYYSAYCGQHLIHYTYGYVASKTEYVLVAIDRVDEQHRRLAKLPFTVGQPCSGWKVMDVVFPDNVRDITGIIINNHVYWPSHRNPPCSEGKEIIVSLDLDGSGSDAAFSIIKSPPIMPEIGLYFDDDYISLIDFKGSLAIVETSHMVTTNTLLLWLLTVGPSSSWMKRFHINLRMILPALSPECACPGLNRVIGPKSSKDGEFIIRPDDRSEWSDRSCYILNPETQTAKHLTAPLPHPTFTTGSDPHPFNIEIVFL